MLIGLLICNIDQKFKDYLVIKDLFCLVYVDYIYYYKYGVCDYCGGGCFLVCEIVMCVVVGVIVKKYLVGLGIQVCGYMSQFGLIEILFRSWDSVEQNVFFSFDLDKVLELEVYMD